MSRYDEVHTHAENTFADDDPRWLTAEVRRAIWEEYRSLIGSLYDYDCGGYGAYDAVSVFFCDGTGIMGGLPASDDDLIEVILGHRVVAVDVATGRVWDTGSGSCLFCYDQQRRRWYPSSGSEWTPKDPKDPYGSGFIGRVMPRELCIGQDDDFVTWGAEAAS